MIFLSVDKSFNNIYFFSPPYNLSCIIVVLKIVIKEAFSVKTSWSIDFKRRLVSVGSVCCRFFSDIVSLTFI